MSFSDSNNNQNTDSNNEKAWVPWSEPEKGSIDGHPVTFSYGTGESNKGETLISDGHDWDEKEYRTNSSDDFFYHENHDHYGSGKGRHNNGTRRGKYTGPGC